MSRPSDPNARARLLDAARAVFSERGLDRAKVEDITTGAQLSKGAFYLHFESKEEAFRELLAGVVSHLEGMLDETSDQQLATSPGVGDFNSYLDACHVKNVEIYEFIWENRALMAMVLEGGGSASYQHLIEDFAQRAQRQTAALIQHGIDIGLYRTDLDPEAAAAFIAGGYDRIARQLVRQQRKPDLESMLREVQWLFLGGIARPEVLVALNRDQQKLSEKRDVERDKSHTGQ
ncbi:MAG TPA: TetR/AcrR family transcriptional regulator, partial [Polyangiaceae bacterium]|nr:TetR/AcrR family transcriptional regulator [Polyangiaceae bacterium]